MSRILITTVPFGNVDRRPLDLLEASGVDFTVNPLNRKLTESELAEMIVGYEAVIAGTEPISEKVIQNAKRLKVVSRVGIGLDNVDLLCAQRRGISVSYTPDAPAPAVAELTVGLALSMLRHTHKANEGMRTGKWNRYFGRRLSELSIGIIGVGRIGSQVLKILTGFGGPEVLANDLCPRDLNYYKRIRWVDKETIYRDADLITLHVPLNSRTKNMITYQNLKVMRPDAILINTSRGGIIHERDLYHALEEGLIGGAAIDVFEEEPYTGMLSASDRCLLTSHMGSMTTDCRVRMELEATQEVIRYFKGERLQQLVPLEEYEAQRVSG